MDNKIKAGINFLRQFLSMNLAEQAWAHVYKPSKNSRRLQLLRLPYLSTSGQSDQYIKIKRKLAHTWPFCIREQILKKESPAHKTEHRETHKNYTESAQGQEQKALFLTFAATVAQIQRLLPPPPPLSTAFFFLLLFAPKKFSSSLRIKTLFCSPVQKLIL